MFPHRFHPSTRWCESRRRGQSRGGRPKVSKRDHGGNDLAVGLGPLLDLSNARYVRGRAGTSPSEPGIPSIESTSTQPSGLEWHRGDFSQIFAGRSAGERYPIHLVRSSRIQHHLRLKSFFFANFHSSLPAGGREIPSDGFTRGRSQSQMVFPRKILCGEKQSLGSGSCDRAATSARMSGFIGHFLSGIVRSVM